MANTTSVDLGKACRVCLNIEKEMFLIFDHKNANEELSIAAMISECTKYKVEYCEELPDLICNNCLEAASNAFNFKRKCEQSYEKLMGVQYNSKIKEDANYFIEKSTQTDETTVYPCERCREKFFTFEALRLHRENEHKGSAIVCRFCSKSFNRIGYLKTHIAVLHPELGFTSHNQCKICKRQFTRKEHMRRHLAVIHKVILSNNEDVGNDEEESFMQTNKSVCDVYTKTDNSELNVDPEKQNDISIILDNDTDYENAQDEASFHDGSSLTDVDDVNSDEEAEKPLVKLINTTSSSGFMAVLLDETTHNDKLAENIEEFGTVLATENGDISKDAPLPAKRKRGRPPKASQKSIQPALPTYTCNNCHKNFYKKKELHDHSCHQLTNDELTCEFCSKSFSNTNLLKNHVQSVHEKKKSIKCENCDRIFEQETQYKRHLERVHSDKVHKCDKCCKKFTTQIYLQRHLARHESKRFICKECAQNFETKDELHAHIKAEGHDKPLLCPECGLRCKTSNILMVHMRRHKGEKPFKCKFCSKGFPRMDDLRVHEKYHTGEKSHFCETCGKGFQRKYNLTIHLRVHTGEKPYKCPHCPQAFAQGNDLKAHIRRHTGERFRCELCDAAFLQGYQIRQHKLLEHGIKEAAPTQRVAKFTSPEEQEQQIKQNLQKEMATIAEPPYAGKTASVKRIETTPIIEVSSLQPTIHEFINDTI